MNMLSDDACQVLVDEILKANGDFNKEMREKAEKEKFFSAAKNGRVNKIDSYIFEAAEKKKLSFIEYCAVKKAGTSNWEYGEYICELELGRVLVIVKSDNASKKFSTNLTSVLEKEEAKYIEDYLSVNERLVYENVAIEGLFEQQTSFFEDDEKSEIFLIADEEVYRNIDIFLILVYRVSGEKITNIWLVFPNPVTKQPKIVQDLTNYIESSKFDSNDNLQYNSSHISPQESDDDIASFDERIIEAEESK